MQAFAHLRSQQKVLHSQRAALLRQLLVCFAGPGMSCKRHQVLQHDLQTAAAEHFLSTCVV